MLELMATPLGVALRAQALSDAVQQSRRELVAAREEERRRLRRDLHDGLGPARVAPAVGVLMLTMLDDDETLRAAVRAGAAGYVLKVSTTAVAVRLGLTPKTVNNNLSTIFGKLGVANRTEAALFARGALRPARAPDGSAD